MLFIAVDEDMDNFINSQLNVQKLFIQKQRLQENKHLMFLDSLKLKQIRVAKRKSYIPKKMEMEFLMKNHAKIHQKNLKNLQRLEIEQFNKYNKKEECKQNK